MYPVPEGAQSSPRKLGAGVQDSWVQVGMTQTVTPTESFPLSSLPASVSSRVGGREQAWQDPAAPPDFPDGSFLPALPSPPQPEMLNTQGPWGPFSQETWQLNRMD